MADTDLAKWGTPKEAAAAHEKAAELHAEAGKAARAERNRGADDDHYKKERTHRAEAKLAHAAAREQDSKEHPAVPDDNIKKGGNIAGGKGAPRLGGGPQTGTTVQDHERKADRRAGWAEDAAADGDHKAAAENHREAAEHYAKAGLKAKAEKHEKAAAAHEAKAGGGGDDRPRDDQGRFASK